MESFRIKRMLMRTTVFQLVGFNRDNTVQRFCLLRVLEKLLTEFVQRYGYLPWYTDK